jgi:mannose-6-phosphate isomerase-like protein (cupin superfamily)
MLLKTRESAPRYQRDGIESFLLIAERTVGAKQLTITLVEMQPGGLQPVHAHLPEQMYFILEGTGVMTVEDERQAVSPNDCVFIPSGSRHGLTNTGGTLLRYLSAASPSFGAEESRQLWPLASLAEEDVRRSALQAAPGR